LLSREPSGALLQERVPAQRLYARHFLFRVIFDYTRGKAAASIQHYPTQKHAIAKPVVRKSVCK
jgi:hypothetical protein